MNDATAARKPPPRRKPGQGCGFRRIAGEALDVRGAATLLGYTEKALRSRVDRRLIPFRRDGRRIVFLRAELLEWLDTLPGCTAAEALQNLEARRALS